MFQKKCCYIDPKKDQKLTEYVDKWWFFAFQAESEVAALNRKVQQIEEDLEKSEERLNTATTKLTEASQAADESSRYILINTFDYLVNFYNLSKKNYYISTFFFSNFCTLW